MKRLKCQLIIHRLRRNSGFFYYRMEKVTIPRSSRSIMEMIKFIVCVRSFFCRMASFIIKINLFSRNLRLT